MLPGKSHFDLITPDLSARMRREIVESYLKHHRAQ